MWGRAAAEFYDRDKDKCVIVVEVTGADSPSVRFETGRRMDGQTKWEKEETCLPGREVSEREDR